MAEARNKKSNSGKSLFPKEIRGVVMEYLVDGLLSGEPGRRTYAVEDLEEVEIEERIPTAVPLQSLDANNKINEAINELHIIRAVSLIVAYVYYNE